MSATLSKTKRGWFMWVAVGLLVAHVGGMAAAVYIAVGDRTFVALPDYYSKSIKWDENRQQQRASDALGWSRTVTMTPDAQGRYVINIAIADNSSSPIKALKAKATIYPELFPNLVQTVAMGETTDGTYATTYVHPAHGPIVIELTATGDANTYVTRAVLMTGRGAAK